MRHITALAALAATLLASAGQLQAEVVSTTPTGFVTRDTAQIAAPPMAVWLALTKPADWWNDEHTWSGDAANLTLTPQAGGCFCETIPGGDAGSASAMDGSARHATVVQAFPLKVMRLRGGLGPLQGEPAEGVLTITLKEIPGGTRVLWEYNVGGPMRFEIPMISAAVDQVMSQQLAGLRSHLGALPDTSPPAASASEPA
ncbi:MAG: SRPBCC family protein, partial [Pseudomonadota bacterium]|nr:SRPBCC family protein [Pseudomonadota bacterium]